MTGDSQTWEYCRTCREWLLYPSPWCVLYEQPPLCRVKQRRLLDQIAVAKRPGEHPTDPARDDG